MQSHDMAIPTLPSRDVNETVTFYRRLGFEGGVHSHGDYAILTRGSLELHFFTHSDLRPEDSSAGCYLRVLDVDSLYRVFAAAELPRQGIPRVTAPENKPWGLREFALVDADGNLVRIGQIIER